MVLSSGVEKQVLSLNLLVGAFHRGSLAKGAKVVQSRKLQDSTRWFAAGQRRLSVCLLLTLMLCAAFASSNAQTKNGFASTNDALDSDIDVQKLQPFIPVERKLVGGETHLYGFSLSQGQYMHALATQQDIDVVLTIFGPAEKQRAEVDRPNGARGLEGISFIALEAGEYRLQIRSLESVASQGQYKIVIDELRGALPRDEQRVAAEAAVTEGEKLRAKGTASYFRQALVKFEDALALWRKLKEPSEEFVALYGAGLCRRSMGENQRAITDFSQAIGLARELKDRYDEAIAQTAIGWAYIYLGDYENALDAFTQSRALRQVIGDRRGETLALYGVGWAHALAGQDEQALVNFFQCLEIKRAVKDHRGEAFNLVGIGKIYNRLGRNTEALDYLQQALKILEASGPKLARADALMNTGWVYLSLSKYDLAMDHFQQALPLWRTIGDRTGEAATLFGISRTERQQGRLIDARAHMDDAVTIIESVRTKGDNQQLRTSYFALVQDYYEFDVDLLMQLQQLDPTGDYASAAFQVSESARNRSLLDLLNEARADIRKGIDPHLIEQEQILHQQMDEAATEQRKLLGGKHTRDELKTAAKTISNLTGLYQDVEAKIRAASPRYASLTPTRPLSALEIQRQVLDKDTVLLEYALGQERSYLWAITNAEIHSYELPKRTEVEAAARHLYALMTARNQRQPDETIEQKRERISRADAEYPAASAELSRILLGPVASLLGAKRLVFVPQGALQLIPFAALPAPSSQPGVASQALLVNHEIVNLPSASTLALLRRDLQGRQKAAKTIAVLADPVFTKTDERFEAKENGKQDASHPSLARSLGPKGEGAAGKSDTMEDEQHLPRLFNTRWEAKQILSLVKPQESLQAIDFAANRAAATSPALGQYRIIHFATHAFINDMHPELSGIILSLFDRAGHPQDGFLRAHEIFNLKLPVELVVLSACRTGLGKEVKGEGLVSLTRGFMYAGSPRVVVSLWSLNDRATAELMAHFYKHMLGPEQASPAAALRLAQIEMLSDERWKPPYYWAAATLQGEWQ
jgi:CHAT domain-containing protein/Tfp pilus assembly protein PilF